MTENTKKAYMLWEQNDSIEWVAAVVLYKVLTCKNTLDRVALCFGTMRRKNDPVADALRVAADFAIERGWLTHGTTNASARAWSRGACDELLYLTKAGRAHLKAVRS